MKKLFALVSALVCVNLMAVQTFAADVNQNGGSQNIDVNAKYENNVETNDVYSVDIVWGSMEFTYSVAGSRDWDVDTHQYVVNETDVWNASGNTVTIVNHSNVSIKADFDYVANSEYASVTGAFDKASITLPSAVGIGTDTESLKAVTGTTALTLGGTLEQSVVNFTKVGKIVITIAKAN